MDKFVKYSGIIALLIIILLFARKFYLYKKAQKEIKANDPNAGSADVANRAVAQALRRL